MKMESSLKLVAVAVLACSFQIASAEGVVANAPSGYQATGDKAIATTNQTPNAFVNAGSAYNESWAAQGCSREAWTELTNSYNASMNDLKAKSQVLDQRILDGVKSPKDINFKGFEFLGCDLGAAFDNLQEVYETALQVIATYNSGDFKSLILDKLKAQALKIAEDYAQRKIASACTKVQSEIAKVDNQIFGEVNRVSSQYSDPAAVATQMMQQAAQQYLK